MENEILKKEVFKMTEKELNQKAREFMEGYNLSQNKKVQTIKNLISEWGVGIDEMWGLIEKAYKERIEEINGWEKGFTDNIDLKNTYLKERSM
jgi:Mg/Co/Ni transporter MgtE